jgi:molybdopterin synthase sulfur carrier subunit
VKFFAGLRKTAGTKESDAPGSDLRAVLDGLSTQNPDLGRQIWDGRTLQSHIVITVNGQTLDPLQGLELPLLPEDEIAIFPPIAGG